ncbi:MAG: adenosylmethionine--8-amino-7-oxononanoate transaminase [Crocinitomicaceae bacterium]|nr:adenosylmethionine--8-amino-7-oxononanoate transaminase [Crocinitomicaceae bacterium]
MTLNERDKKYIWHPFTQAKTALDPIPIVKAEGVWLIDESGNKYIDANSSWWTTIHGHGNAYINQAIKDQLDQLDHTLFAGLTHPKAVEIGERLVNLAGGHFTKAFFSDNGSTAVEVAIKTSIQYWYNQGKAKKRFLAIEGAYHGDTFGAMSVGARDVFNRPFERFFFDVDYLPFPDEQNQAEVLRQAKDLFETGEFAGFIFEPLVQGAAGMRIYDQSILDQLIQMAKDNEVLTIADEVMTGFYRTGTLFATDQIIAEPDFLCLSKGLSGGVLAMGMTITTERIFEAFLDDEFARGMLHGHSFTANPITCAAACASLDLLLKSETQKKIKWLSDQHALFVQNNIDHPSFRSVKSKGTILSIELEVGDKGTYFSSIRDKAYEHFINNQILIRPLGNVIFVNPPYCINETELDMIYEQILDFANTLSIG